MQGRPSTGVKLSRLAPDQTSSSSLSSSSSSSSSSVAPNHHHHHQLHPNNIIIISSCAHHHHHQLRPSSSSSSSSPEQTPEHVCVSVCLSASVSKSQAPLLSSTHRRMWRAMKGSGNTIPAAQHPPEGPPSASLTNCSKDKGEGTEGIPSVLHTARSPRPGTPSVYYRIGSWEDVEVAKAAEAKAEASKGKPDPGMTEAAGSGLPPAPPSTPPGPPASPINARMAYMGNKLRCQSQ